MKKEERKQLLVSHFNKLKDVYYNSIKQTKNLYANNNLSLIADDIVIPMFKLDSELATYLWLYMLKKYAGQCPNSCYSEIASHISMDIGAEETISAMSQRTLLKKYLYSEGQYSLDENPIYYAVRHNNSALADELTDMLSKNDKCVISSQDMLYELLRYLNMDFSLYSRVNQDMVDFAVKWSKKLEDSDKRAEIDLIIDTMRFELEDKKAESSHEDEDNEDNQEDEQEKEDNLSVSPELLNASDDDILRFCQVKFDNSDRVYTYYCPDEHVTEGMSLQIMVGEVYLDATVVKVLNCSKTDLEYPWRKIKRLNVRFVDEKEMIDADRKNDHASDDIRDDAYYDDWDEWDDEEEDDYGRHRESEEVFHTIDGSSPIEAGFSSNFDYNGDGKVDDDDYSFFVTYSSMVEDDGEDED